MLAHDADSEMPYHWREHVKPIEGSSHDGWQKRIRAHRQEMQADRQWFVLSIEPNMERKASAHLIGRRFKVLLPEMLSRGTRGARRTKVSIRRPIFPGYLFLLFSFDLDQDRRHHIDAAVGVHKFLRLGDDYAIIPLNIMARIAAIEEELLKPKKVTGPSALFSPGEVARIAEGPFSGLTAEIETLDDDQRITILLSLLGRASRVQLSADQLEKL